MAKRVDPQSPEFRDLVSSLTSTKLNLPLIDVVRLEKEKDIPEKIGFTGLKDTDFLILMQLDDAELASVCSINKYVKSLCENEIFWLNRILSKLKKACEYASKIPFFKEMNCSSEEFEGNLIQVKNYFGFKTYRELNSYLNKFTKGEQLSIFLFIIYSADFEILLNKIYIISKDQLPNFVDFEKLLFYLRRDIVLEFYHLEVNKHYGNNNIKLPGLTNKLLRKRSSNHEDENRLRNINF